jgi:hypothetical protein
LVPSSTASSPEPAIVSVHSSLPTSKSLVNYWQDLQFEARALAPPTSQPCLICRHKKSSDPSNSDDRIETLHTTTTRANNDINNAIIIVVIVTIITIARK